MKTIAINSLLRVTLLMVAAVLFPAAEVVAIPLGKKDLQRLQEDLKVQGSLYLDFAQTIYKKKRKTTLESNGHAFFARPNKFRWVTVSPEPSEMIFDGKQLINYTEREKSAMIVPLEHGMAASVKQVVDIVLDFEALLKRFSYRDGERIPDGVVKLTLDSKSDSPGEEVETVDLTIDEKNKVVREIVMTFKIGNRTTISFKKKPMPADGLALDKRFEFNPPPGVRVSTLK